LIFRKNKQNQWGLLAGEIDNCIRQAKIWSDIAYIFKDFPSIRENSFLGWMQYQGFRSIVTDGIKLPKDIKKYIKSVIKDIISKDQYNNLIKCSQLQNALDEISDIVTPLKKWRDKRFAHFENHELEVISCDFQNEFYFNPFWH